MDADTPVQVSTFWTIFGTVGSIIFFGRFYVQWIVSERAGRSVMPVVFWYMSSVGSVLLMVFAVVSQSPVGALSQSFNLVVYSRNLLHIWREKGTLTAARSRGVKALVAVVCVVAAVIVAWVWKLEYEIITSGPEHETQQAWLWLAVGVAGQALFAARFIVQWIATERQKKSVIPPMFWYLSVAASLLMAASFLQRREWVFGLGIVATLFIYVRNIWWIHARPEKDQAGAPA